MEAIMRWVAVGLLMGMLQGCVSLADKGAEAIFPNLETPEDMEVPSTFKLFPSSEITQTILGGRGMGLSCSIPKTGRLFFRQEEKSADVNLHFRPACAMHDMCYRHGLATYGYSQADCDRALQAAAFRMCRQIQKPKVDVEDVYALCQTQAKKVLLGVSIGGAGAFRTVGESTYFEYDPMPLRADDYIVARGYALDSQRAAAGELGIVTYHFLRNSVTQRSLKVDPEHPEQLLGLGASRSNAVAYPGQYVATAPTNERIATDKTAMVALARESQNNTALHLIDFALPQAKGKPALKLEKCPSPLLNEQCATEPLGSINKMAWVDGRPMLITFGHNNGTMRLWRRNLASAGQIPNYDLNGGNAINDRYRFLQNDLLLEKDAQGNDTHAWILVRGMKADSNKRIVSTTNGKGFEDRLLVIRQALGDGAAQDIMPVPIDASESVDPLALLRLADGQGVALLGLTWKVSDMLRLEAGKANLSPPLLSIWQFRDNQPVQHSLESLSPELTDRFIDRPPVVVNAPGTAHPLFVWSRLTGAKTDKAAQESKTRMTFDIHLATLNPETSPMMGERGSVRCTLDLEKQVDTAAAAGIRTKARRTHGIEEKKPLDSVTRPLAIKKLFERWKMGQTVVSKRPSEQPGVEDLTVTAIFTGYPGNSFQVVLNHNNGRYQFKHTLPTPDWLHCE